MSLNTSRTAILALSILAAPAAWAQGTGVSVHAKTPPSSPPPVEEQKKPAQVQQAAEQPVQNEQPAEAQQAAPAQQQPETQQATGAAAEPNAAEAGWSPKFGTQPPQVSAFTGAPEQLEIIQKINDYFNNAKNLEGNFLQTDADNERKKGKFYIQRPGKVRFDYSPPSKQKIISDGRYLAVENHDLNTTDRYPIESTPFRLLLAPDVDLMRDARIVALDVGPTVVVVTLEEKAADAAGQIRLFFDWPELQLKEWIVSDPQGLNTRIELANLELNKPADPALFKFSPDLGMPSFKGGSN